MSTAPRLFLDAPLSADGQVALDKDQAHYLLNVMRRRAGDEVRVFNGQHGEWRAQIEHATKRSAALKLYEQTREQTTGVDIELYFAPVKKARTDFIVEKATEMGVSAITPVLTERTNAERVKLERLSLIAREAAEQTERMDVPVLREPVKLNDLIANWSEDRLLLFADEFDATRSIEKKKEVGRPTPLRGVFPAISMGQQCWGLLVGPEGGFSPEERRMLRATESVCPIGLGPRVLRADTAVVAALAVFQSLEGDWVRRHFG